MVVMPLRPPPDAEDKLREIRSVTDAALSHLGADDLLATLLGRVREILDADTAAVLLLDSSGRQLIATAVAGSGLSAAVIMGRIRSALRAYALEFPSPADVLRKLDRKMQYFEENDVMATVSYAVLDPDSGQLAISSAGHLPPVIATPGKSAALAQIAVDPPIGVADAPRRQVTTLALAPGTVVCLFTDGLVERRDEPIDDGITRLCQTVTPGPPEDVCVSVMRALVGRQYPGDDIALLVLRWLPRTSSPGCRHCQLPG